MNYHYNKNTPQYQLCLTYLSPAILSLPAVTPLATSVISQNTPPPHHDYQILSYYNKSMHQAIGLVGVNQ